jgi:CubicO group peptidase (beta-lactamase class C family)
MRLSSLAILALLAAPLSAQADFLHDSASTIVSGARGAAMDSALRVEESRGFSGVVLAVVNGQAVLRKGYGLAVRAPARPFAPSSVVQIGSNTKDFTAVAILQLHAAGKLNIHDSLAKYFPDVPADKRAITIWDLVTHRSGLPLYSGMDFEPVSREQFVSRALALPLKFAPGTSQSYSNVGYSLLAAIIEKVYGDTFGGYCNKVIWQPLGMHDTGLLLVNWDVLRLAHGYQGDVDNGTMLDKPHADNGPYWNLRGNGGYLSTVTDMYRFYDALYNTSKLLPPDVRELRFKADEPAALAGSDMINFFLFERAPREGVVLLVATNASDYKAPRAREAIAPLLGLPPMGGGPRTMGGPRGVAGGAPPKEIALPDTPAGRAAAAYIAMFNAGDTARARMFITERMVRDPSDTRTKDQRVTMFRGMRHNVGTMVPVAIVSSSPTELVLRMRTEHGEQPTLTVGVESTAPNRITQLRIMAEGGE